MREPAEPPKEVSACEVAPETMRHEKPGVIDQRQQRIDPAGKHTYDPNDRPVTNRKQPGGKDHNRALKP
jgi:hypothetical protein